LWGLVPLLASLAGGVVVMSNDKNSMTEEKESIIGEDVY
jgi:hypothetical protein